MNGRKCFVQLGRAGDILNVLPLAEKEYRDTGVPPFFLVAAAYADLLDGVTYVERVIWTGPFELVIPALTVARQLTENVCLTQIYGFGLAPQMLCTSFARESWWVGGFHIPWGSLPLNIDRRDPIREKALLAAVLGDDRTTPFVLVALSGSSSPFPYRKLVMQCFPPWLRIVDLSEIKAGRFFDLLALYDLAKLLVTVDTGHLHLAHASKVPIVPLITRDPSAWHGSPWRPFHRRRFYYDEFPNCLSDFAREVLTAVVLGKSRKKIIHVWADWREGDPSEELRGRVDVAQASWKTEYDTGQWIPAEMKKSHGTRSGQDIGDPHNVQYVHDVVNYGMRFAADSDDIICLTNADTGFTPGLTGQILDVVNRHGAAFSHRRDFDKIPEPFFSEAQVRRGKWYPGSDLFAFTVKWWLEHRDEYADYLMGREGWDEVFRQLVKYHAGGPLLAACWHEWHVSFWCDKQRWTLPGNLHNFALRKKWFEETGFVEEDFRYFRTVEGGAQHPPPYPDEPGRAP